jgi:hypothetical protein
VCSLAEGDERDLKIDPADEPKVPGFFSISFFAVSEFLCHGIFRLIYSLSGLTKVFLQEVIYNSTVIGDSRFAEV